LKNIVLDIEAIGPKDGTSQDMQIYGVEVQGGNPDFSGDLLKIGITTDFVGGGNNQASAFDFYSSDNASISAKEVNLSVTSTASNGKSVYGIGMGGGGTLNVTASSTTGRAAGINTVLEKADDKDVILKVTGDSVLNATTETGTAYGVNLDGATTIDVTGNLTATATANGEGGQAWSVHTDAGTLNLTGQTNTLNGDASVVNAGTLNLGSSSGNSQTNMNGNVSADSTSSIGLTNATLNLAAGKTVNVEGSVNSDNGTIAINGAASEKTVNIATLNNTGSTTFRTSFATAGQIAVGTLNNAGTVNLSLDSTAANGLTGNTVAEIAQNAANVLTVTTRNGEGQYNVDVAESSGVTGAITAKTDENGNIIASTVTERENSVMSSLMNISANNFLVFRSQMNDMDKRMGDLRTIPQASGMWARAIAGQSEYKDMHNTYQTLQIGADRRIGNFLVGAMASYTDGDGSLKNGSSDDKNYSFGLYGSWLGDDGQFVDVTLKRHRLESEYDLAYTSGDRAKGSMDTSGTSLSVEYGWRFNIANTNYYFEPQAEFMYGHLNSVGYTTSNGVRINQDAIKTAVGRLGIAAGWVSPEKPVLLTSKHLS
jgi:outer membrane autotransporter protein